jgi:hypothetical protein
MTISYSDPHFTSQTKEALDHKGIKPLYPAYSMAILWNIDTAVLMSDFERYGTSTPVDGDGLARSAARQHKNDEAWAQLHAAAVELLRENHLDIDRPNR